jgi:hypothetical protein
VTTKSSTEAGQERERTALDEDVAATQPAGDDQAAYRYDYGHGRMPFFMKIVWLGFLAFGAWYVVGFLLAALGDELG